jgi:nitrate reductase NapA
MQSVLLRGGLELLLPERAAADRHKSVRRSCGTGCEIQIGMRDAKVVDVRGDELAHKQGVICLKDSMTRVLPNLPGRLFSPKIRRGGKFVDASWDGALSLVAQKFSEVESGGSEYIPGPTQGRRCEVDQTA